MADATARDGAADAPAVAAAFARYLQTACVPLLGESPALVEAFERDLAVPPASAVVEQFVSDSAARVLQVHAFVIQETAVEGEGTDGAPRPVTYRLRVNLGVEYVAGGKQRGHDTVCFIKRGGVPLTTEVPLTQQLQVMTLGLGKKGDMANKTAETSGNTTEDDDDEDKSDNDDLLAVVYNYVHESFGPLVNEYSRVHQPQTEVTNLNESVRGLPAIRRRMKELELALLQYQQNIEIPEVNLISHPTILRAAELVREKGLLIDNIEALGLEDKVNDVAFLNEIQGGVNRWIKEIQKVTRLISEPLPGTTTQEINFWCDLHRALLSAQSKLASPEVEITLALLKRAKRYLATVTFNADHGLGPALQRVSSVMALMKDFPMNSILSATDITQLTQGVVAVFTHLKKIRVADEYKLSRLLHLVEVMSSDLTEQIVSLMRGYNLIQMPFDQFEHLITQCKELFTTWHRQVAALYELAKELSKRRGTMNTDKPPLLSELQMEHTAIEERLLEVHEFREQHEKLRQVIERVLGSAVDGRSDVTDDALIEINAAYAQFSGVSVLDVTGEGSVTWKNLRKAYDLCIDRVEGRIIASLTSRLSATSNADEMFRVFSKYNALFFRPRIRSAVQQFQMQLIENVKEDVSNLQAKFRAHYALSEASRMSKLRDIPPIAGAVMWAKQIERKLKMLLTRVESVLGPGWEQHVEGKALKVAADAFLAKLNPQLIFDQWVNELASMPIFDIKNIILNIVTEDTPKGERKKLVVAFNQQIVTLFKEVRNLEWLGYRVPFTLKMIAEDAKSKYPYAMSLDASLKAYVSSCSRIQPLFEPLAASYVREVRATIGKTFSKGNEMRWHADGLAEYVADLAMKVERLQDKVEELVLKTAEIEELFDGLRSTKDTKPESIRSTLQKVQTLVDELNLSGYANLGVFVKSLNETVSLILASKLEGVLRSWTECFQKHSDDKLLQTALEAAGITTTTHQILLKNQVLYLEPSIDDARTQWMQLLQSAINSVCDLPKIQASSYENVYGRSALSSPARRAGNPRRRDHVFKDVLLLLPQGLIVQSFSVVDVTISEVENYVSSWLQYQALWDMDAQSAIAAVGEDLEKWQQILLEIKKERNSFDAIHNTKRCGPILINYQQVQAQVNVKYDAWHNEFLSHFGELLFNQINAFYSKISSKRAQLEQHGLEAATSQVVAAITLIQEMRMMRTTWQNDMESFSQGERLLKKQRFKFTSDWPSLANVEGEWDAFIQLLERKSSAMESQLPQLQAKILEEKSALDQKILKTVAEWDASKPLQGGQSPKSALELLLVFDSRFNLLRQEQEKIAAALDAMSITGVGAGASSMNDTRAGTSSALYRVTEELRGLDEVWRCIAQIWTQVEDLNETLWSAVQPRKIRKQIEEIIDEMRQFPARVQQYEAFEHTLASLQGKKSMNALLSELKSDAIRERHWKQILRLLRINSAFSELTLRHFWESRISASDNELKQLIRTAQGEMALDEFIRQVSDYWSNFQLDLVNYQNRCRIIRGWDEMFAKLEEHLNSLSSMKQSPYYRVFAEQAGSWEDKLTKIRGILDFWIDVQRRWVYLEGIFFGSADIKQQLPKEFTRFQSIDNEFTSTMKRVSHNPLIVEVANIPNLYHSLERQQDMMGNVQRALGEYLERQRSAFPRFYFVGDEDLLEMIGNSKEPMQIQRHLSKMFAGIVSLEMDPQSNNSTIIGMVSREGEVVKFKQPVKTQEDTRINVWLGKVEDQMRQTLSLLLEDAVRSYPSDSKPDWYLEWVSQFPAQVVILATQVHWSRSVETSLQSGDGNELQAVSKSIDTVLRILSERVLMDLKNDVRKKYEQLITELVHQKSVTRRLMQGGVNDAEDFRWLYHMRYYFYPSESDPLKKLSIKVSNASFSYGFEYLGVGERLVQTPLTERCYLTLTQALDFGMGGNPFGPAGTGKTESVKALGSQLGRFVLVFNCDEHFDFQAMGRIFVGLCQVGAWGCFDEFNRLEERVLSAVSQQILAIQTGVLTQKKSHELAGTTGATSTTSIELLGKSVRVHPDVGIFVTMNPGYAGRSNLPDNLKQLFRSIAMVAPDRELIAEVMLFSQGITIAEQIASKVVLLFNLCEDQLSKQPHYDFGLRALKSVLVSAGQLKRKLTNGRDDLNDQSLLEQLETKALIGSISDTILPKLVAHDVAVFETLLKGVFPGTELPVADEEVLWSRIVQLAEERGFVAHSKWVEKALQLYQVMQLRHGVMLVGPSGTGKSSAWRILLDALEVVDGKKGEAHVIDPKAISKEHLYGVLDNTTLEWSDGVFTHLLRQVLNSVRGESEKRHWIVFDGDVDPEWAENLNSVLDDNRLLTLPSGERLEIPPNVWIMMETETLRYATLATVSRCGMVWFSAETVQTAHIVEYYLKSISSDFSQISSFTMQPNDSERLRKTANIFVQSIREVIGMSGDAGMLVESCLSHASILSHIMEVTSLRLLMSMFSLLARGLSRIHEYNEAHSDFPMADDQVRTFATKWLAFSIVWGFGGSMDFANRLQLCEFVLTNLESRVDFPVTSMSMGDENSLLEYEVNVDDGQWRHWSRSVPQLDLESHRVLSTDVVITTVDTLRHVEVLRGWLSQHRPLILCGPPGSGKTMTLTSTISSLPEFDFASLNFSSGTTPELILKTFAQYCEYKRTPNGMVLTPNAPEKWLVVFCDEVNLPEADAYGTQKVITFLRQLIEQGGFWLGGKNTWVKLQRIQFVGACNPPTDPGRVPLSLRLLRHAPVLLVDFPSYSSLKQIYGTFNRALLKLTPSLKSYVQPLTDAMVDVYTSNQKHFTAEMRPHYIYSPRELSRWMRALYEAIEPLEYEIDVEGLVKLVFHEALRLFMDRLVTPDEQAWCFQTAKQILRNHFPQCSTILEALDYGGKNVVLFSTWLSKHYTEASSNDLRKHIEARLRVFNEEELNVQLVVFDSVIDHVLRIDRVLRQPLGHLLLVGESGAGKTVLSRFVSWMNGMSVFQIKLTSNYTLDNFDDDLRVVLKRAGCDGEKICFIFDESNVLDSAFLERMNALLASGEVPGLFEDDDFTSLMHACREAVQRDSVMVENTEDELFRYFTRQVQRNLHVVFTMNPASGDFRNRTNTSPALFNRCVVDWFGTWNDHALAQVAYEFTNSLDLAGAEDYILPREAEDILSLLVPKHIASGSSFRDSLVASIVQLHHAVLTHMRRLQKRHMKYNHISPRDYLEFIRQFVALYSEKRSQLEDQQLHLNVGVQKLKATHEQVAELQKQLALKERELKKKDIEANEKLQQMIREQNEAQEKKKETEKLASDLAARDEEISSRKKVVEADLAEAEPALLDAQASVNSIRKSQLDEIRALARPPNAVKMTLEAVAIMLGETSLDWADLRKFIRRDDFISQVVNFDSEKLTGKQRQIIQTNYVQNADEFEYEKVNRASKACGPLYKWVISQLNYTRILHSIQPLREEVQSLIEKSADLRQRYESAKTTIDALEVRIENYKLEYASLINEAQMITNDMAGVTKKVERSVALLKSLLAESERWEAGSNNFDSQMKTLVGDTLLSSAFLTYVGFLDFQQRKILIQDWRDILDSMAIPMNPQLSFVDYLSRPNQQLDWQMSDLPSDELCFENAIILERFHRFPLIIDPSGQANNFILKYYALKTNTKIAQTSFLDSSFMKVLASAIRFGTALLVHEVENIDPILNPVLNRELYKTGGRVLIRLGGEEIDYSPDFRLFLITRDPSCRFTPDICSRVTFVNFTVTPSSLESQSLSMLMKHEQPEAEEKRNNLLKLQGEYQARLRELEDLLLQQINNVQGNILDDDSVINALESTKAEAAQISRQVAETQTTMESVVAATKLYNPLARGSSRLYFALEALSSVHFLYQYSLGYFLSVLTSVLSSTTSGDSGSTMRLRELSKSLFSHIAGRVSRGLTEADKLMFALRLAQIYLDLSRETNEAIGDQSVSSADFPADEEVDLLVNHSTLLARPEHSRSRDQIENCVTAFSADELSRLLKLLAVPTFQHLEEHIRQNPAAWNAFIRHPAPEKVTPQGWDSEVVDQGVMPRRAAFRRMVLIQVLRPDRTIYAAEFFVNAVFGADFPWRGDIELRKNVETDTQATRAVLLCSTSGFDASAQVDELAVTLQKRYNSISMGSSEGFDTAEKCLNTALKNGSWVLLRNVHLCPSWLVGVEKKLYNCRDSVHPSFRLFLTSEIHPNLPVNLLRMCDIFVFEAPSGVKSSMIRSMDGVPPERMNKAPVERARLYLLLSWFHAIVQERLRYAPVGWSKAYEFSQADFRGACDVIDRWIHSVGNNRVHVAPDVIPWIAIRTTLKESVYGGRIDNEFDEQLLDALLNKVFTPDSYSNSFELVNDDDVVTIAEGKTKQQFVEWIQQLPSANPPSWLGLPRSAETMLLTNQGQTMLRNFQAMQDQYGNEDLTSSGDEETMVLGTADSAKQTESADARPKWVQDLDRRVSAWLQDLPEALPSLSRDASHFSDPMYRCVFREVELGNDFLVAVRSLLSTVLDVCHYKIKPTNDVREAMQTLYRDKVPTAWARMYQVFDELSLPQWIDDFCRRVKQLHSLASVARNPLDVLTISSGVWVGGLFSPEAFVTAVRQHVAATLQCSLDQLRLVADVRPSTSSEGIGSFAVRGFQIEGASWTPSGFAPSSAIRHNLDAVYLRWVPATELESASSSMRRLPVYSSAHREHLMFSVAVTVDEQEFPASKWVQRSVALSMWQFTTV